MNNVARTFGSFLSSLRPHHTVSRRYVQTVRALLNNVLVESSGWFGVRCVFKFAGDPDPLYEERVTAWQASDPDEAIRLAETEAADYVEDIGGEYLGLAQVYTMTTDLVAGAEVFSLMRTSPLSSSVYLDTFFDTGTERQTITEV